MLTENTFRMRDQLTLHTLSLLPETPVAVILFVHGLGEHIGRYQEYFEFFQEHDIACVGIDLRGHGKSEGKQGHVNRYEDFLDDVEEYASYVKKSFPDIPLFLYGHSMGGNIALNYLIRRNPSMIKAGIITSPWLSLRVKPSSLKLLLAKIMQHLFPAYSESNALDPAHLSHDPEVEKKYKEDPLVHEKISAGCFASCVKAGEYAMRHASELKIPILLIHGGADPITSPSSSKSFAEANKDKVTLKIYDHMLHETHNETDKEVVYKDVLSWLNKQL
jgi:alpha-beta hydrolase superfamily lysophospholipase